MEESKEIAASDVNASGGDDPEFLLNLVEEMDQLALTVATDLRVDRVVIGIVHDENLVSVGAFPSLGPSFGEREKSLSDTICSITMESGKRVEMPDARIDPEYCNSTCVVAGDTVGYMGVPIRTRDAEVVGAICCVTVQPRSWVTFERRYVEQIARNAELILFKGPSREELDELTKDLGNLDQIISALSSQTKMPISIYNADGELVFVNAALIENVPIKFVSDYLIKRGVHKLLRQHEDGSAMSGNVDETAVVTTSGEDHSYSVTATASASGLIVCSWSQRPKTISIV